MKVDGQIAAQAGAPVGQEGEIVTRMWTVLGICNAVMTTAILSLDLTHHTTAAMTLATPHSPFRDPFAQ